MTLSLNSDPNDGYDSLAVERAREFARDIILPHAETWEGVGEYPLDIVRTAMKEFGSTLISPRYGGQGGTLVTMLRILEEFGKADIGFSLAFVVPVNVALTVAMSENISLIERCLPLLHSGERLGAFCLTEQSGGSDAAALTTSARRDGEGFRVSGAKSWILNSSNAEILAVFARVEGEGKGPGIATFLVNADRPGLVRGERYKMIAGNLTHCADVIFEDFEVKPGEVLFPPGQGFKAAMRALDAARIGIAAICNGALHAGLECSLGYAANRRLFRTSLLEKQGIQWAFADQLTALEASRLLTYRAGALFDSGKGSPVMSAHAKKFANQAVSNGLAWAMRAMGAVGTTRRFPLARQLAAAELLFNTDGTPEVMNLIIGRSLEEQFST